MPYWVLTLLDRGCNRDQKNAINRAYDNFKTLSNQAGVRKIEFNSAAAVDYLGPPGFNKKQQERIQAVFTNAATVYPGSILNPFQYSIVVRCDDPFKRCHDDDPERDPCNPHPEPNPPDGSTRTSAVNAYSRNKDPSDASASGMVNFCKNFFNKNNLDNAIARGRQLDRNDNLRLTNYLNQGEMVHAGDLRSICWQLTAETLFHELLHLDLVADSINNQPNPVVDDMTITWNERNKGDQLVLKEGRVYGPLRAKLMARFQPESFDSPTGWFVQRNGK
jgi:hypothetical protein